MEDKVEDIIEDINLMQGESIAKDKPKRKKSNLGVKITVLIVMLAMAVASFMVCYQVIIAEAHARYIGIKNVSAEKVSKIIRGAEMNANNIFYEVEANMDSPESVIAALRSKVNLNLDVRGYFAAFVPNYFPEKGIWFEPYIFQPEYGGFEFRQVGSARHNYTKSSWYIRAQESSHSFWSDPYYYYDGTSLSGHYTTYIKPIFDAQGNLACVCGADMKFEWMAKELEWVDNYSRSNKMLNKYQIFDNDDFYTVILSNDGTCLAHPEGKEMTFKNLDMLKDLQQSKNGVLEMDIDGEACTVYYGPIEYIDWSVAVIAHKHDIMKPLWPIAIILLSMVAVGMIIVWLVCKR